MHEHPGNLKIIKWFSASFGKCIDDVGPCESLIKRVSSIACLEITQNKTRYPAEALVTSVDSRISQSVKSVNSSCNFDRFMVGPWRKENFAGVGLEVELVPTDPPIKLPGDII